MIRKVVLLTTIVGFVQMNAYGQLARLKIKPAKQLTTTITDCTSLQVFTRDGVIALSELVSARFIKQTPDTALVNKLKKAGVQVYIGNQTEESDQSETYNPRGSREFDAMASIGAGLGLDYGGIGGKLELFPYAPLGLFAGVGSNIAGTGFNAGLDINFNPYKPDTPFLLAMYGFNAVVDERYVFKGFSFGIGGKFGLGADKRANLAIALVYPIREEALQNSIRQGLIKASPILFSVGLNFNLGGK